MSYDSEIKIMQQHLEEFGDLCPDMTHVSVMVSVSVERLCHLVCDEARKSQESGRTDKVVLQTDYFPPKDGKPGWIGVTTYAPFVTLTAKLI
jgi:hypothetical protein